MAAIFIFCMISSLKPYVGLSCNFVEDIGRGNNLRHSMNVANTEYGSIFDLQGKFSLHKIIQIRVCQNKAVQAVPYRPLRQNI